MRKSKTCCKNRTPPLQIRRRLPAYTLRGRRRLILLSYIRPIAHKIEDSKGHLRGGAYDKILLWEGRKMEKDIDDLIYGSAETVHSER